jgi:hypothetical protein
MVEMVEMFMMVAMPAKRRGIAFFCSIYHGCRVRTIMRMACGWSFRYCHISGGLGAHGNPHGIRHSVCKTSRAEKEGKIS